MKNITELLSSMRSIGKLYGSYFEPVCQKHNINHGEADILAFLANNPNLNTARDIVEYRMIPKANVSQTVDSLIQKGLLSRSGDPNDRRRIHLSITDSGNLIVPDIQNAQKDFLHTLFSGFSEDEFQTFQELNMRIISNASEHLNK